MLENTRKKALLTRECQRLYVLHQLVDKVVCVALLENMLDAGFLGKLDGEMELSFVD